MTSAFASRPSHLLSFDDDLMFGPLDDPGRKEAITLRRSWWPILAYGGPRAFVMDDLLANWTAFWSAMASVTPMDSLVIWAADNPTEQTGLRAALAAVNPAIPVSVVHVTRAYMERYSQVIHHTCNIPSEHLGSLEPAQELLSNSQRENLLNNWRQLLRDGGILRHYMHGEPVTTKPPNLWDLFILEQAENIGMKCHWVVTARLVGACLAHQNQCTSDLFFFWRIRGLIASKHLWYRGSLDDMRTSTIALPQ